MSARTFAHGRCARLRLSVTAKGSTRRVRARAAERSIDELKAGIGDFYDESSELWESMWGEHMHHGYYPNGTLRLDHQQAQVDMIEEALRFADVSSVSRGVDVGCGIGGSSRYIAKKYGATMDAVTLSPRQAARGNELNASAGLGDKVSLQVADAMNMPFDSGSYDLVWSMESGEHMPTKPQFVNELCRVTAPGGRVIVVTWCHRDLAPGETSLSWDEQLILDRICDAYYLPKWCSVADYKDLFEKEGMEDVRTTDWSDEVSWFWLAVIATALTPQGLTGVLRAGPKTLQGALVMPLMQLGYRRGVIKFGVITARKPNAAD